MKNFACILLFVITPLFSFAQTFKWVKSGGHHTNDIADAITEYDGFLYVGGKTGYGLTSGATIDGYQLPTGKVFFAKTTKNGNIIWIKHYNTDNGIVRKITSDKEGNIYVVINAEYLTIDNVVYENGGLSSIYIIKYNTSGTPIFVRTIVGAYHSHIIDLPRSNIVFDTNNNMYLTGQFENKCTMDNITLNSNNENSYDVFIAKLSPNGSFIWAKRYGSQSDDYSNGLVIDKNNYIYVTSYMENAIEIDNFQIYNDINQHKGYNLLAKFNTDGFLVSYQTSKGAPAIAHDIAINNDDEIYLAGTYSFVPSLNDLTWFSSLTLTSYTYQMSQISHTFLLKYSTNGEALWLKSFATNASNYSPIYFSQPLRLATNNEGDVYITGNIEVNNSNPYNVLPPTNGRKGFYIAKHSKIGYQQWCKIIDRGGNYLDYISDIFINNNNNIFISGYYSSLSLNFDNNIINNKSGNANYDLFFTELEDLTTSSCPPKGTTIQQSAIICADAIHTITSQYAYAQETLWLRNNQIHLRGAYPSIQVNQTGAYQLVVNPFTSCADTSNVVNIQVLPYPSKNVEGKNIICEGESTTLNAENNPAYTYQWYMNQQPINGATNHSITVSTPAEYLVHITNQNLCKTISNKIILQIVPKQEDFLPDSLFFCKNNSITITPRSLQGIWDYKWEGGENTQSITVEKPNIYALTVSRNGCSYTDRVTVSFYDDFIPNIITPNNDGKNDTWVISTSKGQTFQVEIFDRNGSLVYQNIDYRNDWDGGNLPIGSYYFYLKNITCQTSMKGIINIIR